MSELYRFEFKAKFRGNYVPAGTIAFTRKDGGTCICNESQLQEAIKDHGITEYYKIMPDNSYVLFKVQEATP